MIALSRRDRALAVALSLLAGFVDAIGFVLTGGFFVSFMSGNSTRLGAALAAGERAALLAGLLIAMFVAGVVLGALVGRWAGAGKRRAILALTGGLLALAALLGDLGAPDVAVALVALAMGAENIFFEEAGEVRLGLTYMTGRLVKIGQAIAAALSGGARWGWVPHLLLWLGLLGGATLGTLAHHWLGSDALWLAALWTLALLALKLVLPDAEA